MGGRKALRKLEGTRDPRGGCTGSAASKVSSARWRDIAPRRKVLIVEDDLSISNLLYVLLDELNYDGDVALGGWQALKMIERTAFDAILLDLRYCNSAVAQCISRIAEIRPRLLDRVLVITGEVTDAATLDLIVRHCVRHLPQRRFMQSITESLRSLWSTAATTSDC